MSTPSNNENKDNENKDKKNIKKKVNIKQKKIQETTTIDVNDVNNVNVLNDVNNVNVLNDVNNVNVIVNIITLETDKKDKKDKTDKEKIPKKTIVRGGKKIKKADDTNYLRLPEDIKTGLLDFYNSTEDTKNENDKKNKIGLIRSAISKIHQILWDSQQLKPDSTLEEVMNLMFLKYLSIFASETNENGKIDLLNQAHYIDDTGDKGDKGKLKIDISVDTFTKCLYYIKNFNLMYIDMKKFKDEGKCARFEDFRCNANEGTDYIKGITNILKLHPVTKLIFNDKMNDILQIRNPETLLEILEILNKDCFSCSNDIEDLIGEIYEYFINDYMKSKSALGQYFTPRTLMDITLKLKNQDIVNAIEYFKENNDIFKTNNELHICDKTMGTGGWLVKFYNHFKDIHKNIILQGYEVDPKTYNYGIINMLTTTGVYSKYSRCDSSLTVVPDAKIHFGTSNPPFSAGLTYKILEKEYNANKKRFNKLVDDGHKEYRTYNNTPFEEIYFLKNENSTPLQILQLYIHQLVEGGMCFIVIPYGELFNKDGVEIISTRRKLLDKINITDIIVCPGGLFTYTDTKVCMLIFKKDATGTKAITFGKYEFNSQNHKDKKRYLKYYRKYSTVSITDIRKEPICSFYHMDYLHDENAHALINSGKMTDCEWVEFGNVFDLVKGELQSSKVEEDLTGDGVFINWSLYDNYKKISKYSLDGENVFISTAMPNGKDGGYVVIKYYNGKCDYGDLMSRLVIKDNYINKLSIKFISYYLNSIKKHIETVYERGSCNKSLDVKNFNRMKIPIPSLDVQLAYINCVSDGVNKITELSNFNPNLQQLSYIEKLAQTLKTTDVKDLFELAIQKQIKLPSIQWIPFGDVFDLVKGELQSSKVEEDLTGDGVFINWSLYDNYKKISKYSLDGENVFISTAMPNGKDGGYVVIKYYNGKCDYGDLMSRLVIKDNYINKLSIKFISYYLNSIKKHIETVYERGSCNKSLDVKNFNRMKIPIPPIEAQNDIVNEINEVESIAKRWQNDIEYLKNKKGNRMLDNLNLSQQ